MAEVNLDLELELARARKRKAEAQNTNLEGDIAARRPFTSDNPEVAQRAQYGAGKISPLQMKKEVIAAGGPDERTFMEKYNSKQPTLRDLPDTLMGIGKGVVNAATEVVKGKTNEGEFINDRINEVENPYLKTAAKVGHYAVNPIGVGLDALFSNGDDRQGAATENSEKVLPTLKPDEGTVQEVFTPAAQMGAGVAAGGLAGGAVKTGSKIVNAAGRLIGGELGMTGTMDKDTQAVVTGKDSSLAEKTGHSIPSIGNTVDGKDPASQEFKKSLIVAQDALTTGAATGAFGAGAGWALGMAKSISSGITKWKNLDSISRDYVEAILELSAKIPANATKEQRDAAYRQIINYVIENKDIAMKLGDDKLDDVAYHNDIITAISKKLDPNNRGQDILRRQLESLRASAREADKTQIDEAMTGPKRNLNKVLNQIDETRGGDEAIQQTTQALQRGGREEVEASKIPLDKANEDLVNAQKGGEQVLRSDPVYGPKLDAAEKSGVKLDINKESRDLRDQIVVNHNEAETAFKADRNAAHEAIPKETPADMKSFTEKYTAVKKQLPAHIQELIDASDGSYAYLQNKVRPALSQYIGNLKHTPDPNVNFKGVIDLQNNIRKDQIDTLASGGNEATRNAALKAQTEDVAYGQKFNDTLGRELKDNARKNLPTQPGSFMEEGRSKVLAAIKNPDKVESIKQLRGVLGSEYGKKSEHLIDDVIFAEGTKDLIAKVSSNTKISDVELDELIKPLQNMAGNLSEAGRKRAEDLFTNLRDRKWDVNKLKEDIKIFEKEAADKTAEVYDGYLGEFFKRNGKGEYDDLPNGSEIFEKVFRDKQANVGGNFDKMLDLASKDPNAQKGLEAVWAQTAKKRLNLTDDSALSLGKEVGVLDKEFLDVGKKIYKDKPKVIDAIEFLNKESVSMDAASKAPLGGALSVTTNQSEAVTSMQSIVTMVWGVLNPTAARIRIIGNDVLKKGDSKAIARKAIGTVISNADEFQRIATEIADKKLTQLSPEHKKLIYNWVVKTGMYGDGPSDLTEQTNKALGK